MKKILITGLTGSGKTTLARALAPIIGATVFDGDDVRKSYPVQPGFTAPERALHAHHMGTLCDAVTASGNFAIASFICPTEHTRAQFAPDFTIWCLALGDQKYRDTMDMWRDPQRWDLQVHMGHPPEYWAEIAADMLRPVFNPMLPTALFVGRWHPFHAGHKALIVRGISEYGQVAIACRDENRQWPFERVRQRIEYALREYTGKFVVLPVPNIAAVCYGRDVGYEIKQYGLTPGLEAVSGTEQRKLMGGGDDWTAGGHVFVQSSARLKASTGDREHLHGRGEQRGPSVPEIRQEAARLGNVGGAQEAPLWHVYHGDEPV